MSEKTSVNQPLCKLLKPLNPKRIENMFGSGLPDIHLSTGWIESKYRKDYPVRANTPVVLKHPYTKEQKDFAADEEKAGGKVWLVVKVSRDWYIFEYPNSLLVGTLTKSEMQDKCLAWFKNEPKQYDLLPIFQGRYKKDYDTRVVNVESTPDELNEELDSLLHKHFPLFCRSTIYNQIDAEIFPYRGSPLEAKIKQLRFLLGEDK